MNPMDEIETFCPECGWHGNMEVIELPATLRVMGEDVSYEKLTAFCPRCNTENGDSRLVGASQKRAYDIYRYSHDIMSPEDLKALRNAYGLSVRQFSRFLGFGDQTEHRYEKGSIPDRVHANTLREAMTPDGAARLLASNRDQMDVDSVFLVESYIARNGMSASKFRTWASLLGSIRSPADRGFREFDEGRVAAIVYEFASRCKSLYWTKLQKAMYFLDNLAFSRTATSMTGLSYAHADHGPIMDQKEGVKAVLFYSGAVSFEEQDVGDIVTPRQRPDIELSDRDMALIDEVVNMVNTFSTCGEISNYSHSLSSWSKTNSGEIIPYIGNADEVANAITQRLAVHGTS